MRTAIIIATACAMLTTPAFASERERGDARKPEYASEKSSRCPQRAEAEWMSVEQTVAKLKEQGYTVREIERSRGCYEVEATDAQGVKVEIYVDPTTATIVKREGRS